MNKNKSKEKDKIKTLEIKLRHLENQHFVVKKQYEKTTGEYIKILNEISNVNIQLQREIAERKHTEEELRKVHDELEIRVHERTRELVKTNKELQKEIIERKKAEKILQDGETFNFALFEYNPIETIVVDKKGKIIKTNLVKKISDDRLPNIGDVMYKDYAGLHKVDMFSELMNSIRTNKVRKFSELKYGDKFLKITLSPFPEGAIIISEDVTESKLLGDKLKESEEKYRKIIENIYDIVYSSYADGTVCFVSPNVQSITGYKPEEIIGHNILEFVYPDDREHVLSDFEKTIKTGEEFPTIFRLSKKDGSYFYVEEFGKVVREEDKIVGVTGVLRDIIERKQAEKDLLESEERFRSLFESAPEFIHILDRNGMILQTNPSVTLRSGYTEEEIVGRSLAEFLTPASQKILVREFPVLMEQGNHRAEVEFVCKDGKIIVTDCSCTVVSDERGKFAYIVTFLRDITERKKAEEKLKLTQKELEIKTKNLEETNTALKVLLKHQDTEKNTMEKNILSSLRTLVLPYLEKIKIGTSDERKKTYINIIETNLTEITKPFAYQLTEYYTKFTPTEIQIANLIRENKTAKDIAGILDISETTVFFHRRNIRSKLGLKSKKINLLSYLQSLASK